MVSLNNAQDKISHLSMDLIGMGVVKRALILIFIESCSIGSQQNANRQIKIVFILLGFRELLKSYFWDYGIHTELVYRLYVTKHSYYI